MPQKKNVFWGVSAYFWSISVLSWGVSMSPESYWLQTQSDLNSSEGSWWSRKVAENPEVYLMAVWSGVGFLVWTSPSAVWSGILLAPSLTSLNSSEGSRWSLNNFECSRIWNMASTIQIWIWSWSMASTERIWISTSLGFEDPEPLYSA